MSIKVTAEQQLGFLSRHMWPLLKAIVEGYSGDPVGDSDLDCEQPIVVRMTLGDYREAYRLKHELEKGGTQ